MLGVIVGCFRLREKDDDLLISDTEPIYANLQGLKPFTQRDVWWRGATIFMECIETAARRHPIRLECCTAGTDPRETDICSTAGTDPRDDAYFIMLTLPAQSSHSNRILYIFLST